VSNKPASKPQASAKVRAASGSGRSSSAWIWVGLVALIVVVGVVAILVGRSSSSGSASGGSSSPSGGTVVPSGKLEYGAVEVQGSALPAAPSSGPDTAVGLTIPTIKGITFDESTVTISPGGKPKVIMGVAHWCPHCQAEVPRIQDWLDQNGMPDDVELVAVATSNDPSRPNFPAAPWLRKEGWSVPTMLDDKENAAAQGLGITGFPAFIVVDKDGKVVFRTSGEITMAQWESLLQAARTGTAPTS
jgi:thiol-disulfide isomerase/thioredoxin